MMTHCDIVIIGGGPAGLAAAIAAYDSGATDVVVLEQGKTAGGILLQCIHNGFGLTRFQESLSGPEYAYRFLHEAQKRGIRILTETLVLSLNAQKQVTAVNPQRGVFTLQAKAVILATGCRERSRGALNVAGSRPAGIYSAGTAQRYVNCMGYLPGKKIVILGSGDIGLIMARRMTLEGAKVEAVCEIMPYSSGLKRNIEQCLNDFNIPLYLNHTITKIEGYPRVTGVVVSKVDENKNPIAGTEMHFDCDAVLFSVGLIPENGLANQAGIPLSPRSKGAVVYQNRETQINGIFACGNVLQVHDLVDFVSEEAEIAGRAAAQLVKEGAHERSEIECKNGENISYVLPHKIDKNIRGAVKMFFRVTRPVKGCVVRVTDNNGTLLERKKPAALPGEMETLVLSQEIVDRAQGEICISLGVTE